MTSEKTNRALLVDDEDHIRMLMRQVLENIGFIDEVVEASNGREALEQLRLHSPDLILLDINMPYMTGLETLRAILQENPEALVIMLTSLSSMEMVQQSIEEGASDYIRKDTPVHKLMNMILETWNEHQAELDDSEVS